MGNSILVFPFFSFFFFLFFASQFVPHGDYHFVLLSIASTIQHPKLPEWRLLGLAQTAVGRTYYFALPRVA